MFKITKESEVFLRNLLKMIDDCTNALGLFEYCDESNLHVAYELVDMATSNASIDAIELMRSAASEMILNGQYWNIEELQGFDYRQDADSWNERYAPLMDPRDLGRELQFATHDEYLDAAISMSEMYGAMNGQSGRRHLWTLVDSDDGEKLILVPGMAHVNVVCFMVTEIPHSVGIEGINRFEVVYHEY